MFNSVKTERPGFINYQVKYEFLQDHSFHLRELTAPNMLLPAIKAGDFILGQNLGGYDHQNHIIYINTIYNKDVLVETIAHEFKHAIQYMENPEGFKKFETLMRRINLFSDYNRYFMDPLEIDARIFSSKYCLYVKGLMSRETFLALL